jgi:hypothetical protein
MRMVPQDVRSREDLVVFIAQLRQEFESGAVWENDSLPTFLEALEAWVRDMDGWFQNRNEVEPDRPSWMHVATMLSAATLYE